MNFLPAMPDPLHPALVHFPVVLILLGAAAAAVTVFWRKAQLPVYAAVLLTLGALGAWVAVATGKADGGLVETSSPAMSALLDAHETWAERTRTAATVAAFLAAGSLALVRRIPRAATAAAVATALAAATAAWTVYETGHRGGALVYHHGAGVNITAATPAAGTPVSESAHEQHLAADRD
jgi:uncharacterized membrane protein